MTTSDAADCEQEAETPNTTATPASSPPDHSNDDKPKPVQYNNGDVYEGELKDGKMHGVGVYKNSGGNVMYDGEWRDGKMHGRGIPKYMYEGEWKGDLMHGAGTYTYADGNVYEGEFDNNNFQGRGTLKEKNGAVYVGDWKIDKRHGKGTQTYSSGNVYEGEFKDDMKHGRGIMKYSWGGVYDGQWVEGNPNGRGTQTYASGNIYEGCWVGGERHGRGTMKFSSGNVYEGQWLEGLQHGEGTLKWKSGNAYTGEFVGGKRHGWGTMTYASGDVYEGQWVEGKQHGKAFKTEGRKKAESKEGASPSVPSASARTNDAAPATAGRELSNRRTRDLSKNLYSERQMRSEKSQQRRLHNSTAAKKTCEKCGADDYHYKLRVCSECNLALYCSAACQKASSGSHRRICDIISHLPPNDADRLILGYDKDKMIDFDAGLHYGKKYMGNLKHLAIDLGKMDEDDAAIKSDDAIKLSAKRLSSLLRSKKGSLDSFFWFNGNTRVPGITKNGHAVWTELQDLKQLTLRCAEFDDVQPLHDIILQQRNTLMVLSLPYLRIDWPKAKSRRTMALAVNSCKHLLRLELSGCVLMDSDLKIMLADLPNLRILDLRRERYSHEFTDNTCGLIARKCPGLQELNLNCHNHLSVRGIRKIFEGCVHLRSFVATTRKWSCKDVHSLLNTAPQLLYVSLGSKNRNALSEDELSKIIEATGGRTVLGMFEPDSTSISAKTREKYECQDRLRHEIWSKWDDPEVVNEWAGMWEG